MFDRIKRILMNEADKSPGGGGLPATVPPTAPPANQGAAPLTREDLQAFAKATHDGIFAELRRTGVLREGKPKAKEKVTEGDPPETSNATSAPDPIKMRGLDRVVSRLGYAAQLNETSYQRLERAFIEDQPSDPEAWVKDYFSGFGVAQPTTQAKPADPPPAGTTTTAKPGQNPKTDPITSRGAPPTGTVPVEDINLWTASEADRDAYIRAKGIRGYTAKLREQGKSIRIRTRE